jgi:hypothetical protein
MEQELAFIELLNLAISKGRFEDYQVTPIRVSRIVLDRELGYRSKIDRRPELLNDLRLYGQTKYRMFLKERERDSRIKEQDSRVAAA